ncbi:MAG: hypothetical protein ACRCTP_04020 [Aeromonas popoffii]|uniref:hypothetical protein n=1 Tax=Aeromonas popoffii TaxID=70856 RepID=UPI003F3797E9
MLKQLFEGVDGLNEELINRMQPLYEAAVDQRVSERLDETAAPLKAEIEELRNQLAESAAHNAVETAKVMAEGVDNFLDMAVADWANKNSEKLQGTALTEAASVFMAQICEAAKQFNVIIPESDTNAVETLTAQLAQNQVRLNDAVNEAANSRSELLKIKKVGIINEVAVGMTDAGRDRLMDQSMAARFEDEKSFKSLAEAHRMIIEKKIKEDDLFGAGDAGHGKQKPDGTLTEEEKEAKEKQDKEDADKKAKEEEEGKKKGMNESVDMNVFSGLFKTKA